MVIVDTSVWIDLLRDAATAQVDWLDRRLGMDEIAIGDLILTEVLQGAQTEDDAAEIQALLESIPVFDLGGEARARRAAAHYRRLRALGATVRKLPDLYIATFCLDMNHELLHNDRDFDPFEKYLGLRVVR